MGLRKFVLPVVIVGAWLVRPCWAGEAIAPAEQWLPQDAVLVVRVMQPERLLDLALSPGVTKAVAGSAPYRALAASPQGKGFFQGVRFLEAALGTTWPEAIRKLSARGLTFAVSPGGKAILIVDGEDADLLARLHLILVTIARQEAEKLGDAARVTSARYGDVTGWTFNGQERHAIVGSRFVWCNSREGFERLMELRKGSAQGVLAAVPAYGEAMKAAGPVAAVAFVNMKTLGQVPAIKGTLENHGNPLAGLLVAGIQEALRQSNWVCAALGVEGRSVSLRITSDGKADSSQAAFMHPKDGEGVLPNLSVPRRMAALSLYRDLHAFYAAKDTLFPERTSGLIFFENMMGIFFSGRDLTDEVLSQLRPEIRLVVAQQQYDAEVGVPAVQIPGFAAVFPVRDPKRFGAILEEAWQKALGLVNFTRGQQGQPGMILDRPEYHGTKYTVASFSTAGLEKKTDLDTRFNFRPALAILGDYVVLSSTEQLARDLMEALEKEKKESPKQAAGIDSRLEVDLTAGSELVQANRELLVRQNMVEKGNSQEQAEATIGLIGMALGYLGKAKVEIGSQNGRSGATLRLELNTP